MNRAAALACLACLVPATAFAGPTVGIAFGKTEAKTDAGDGADANTTDGLFVRGRLARMLSIQGEVSRVQTDDGSSSTIRTVNAAAVFDLGHGALVPIALAGVGMDVVSPQYGDDTKYIHGELGVGLEYRFAGGFVLGADVRIGSRSLQSQPDVAYPVGTAGVSTKSPSVAPLYSASTLSEGEYRSARLTLGVRF